MFGNIDMLNKFKRYSEVVFERSSTDAAVAIVFGGFGDKLNKFKIY